MRKSLQKLLLWSVAVVVLIGVGGWFLARQTRGQVVTLKDGTKLTLLSWSYGREHVLRLRGTKWWETFLPPRTIYQEKAETESLMLYLKVDDLPNPRTNLFTGGPARSWWNRMEVADENGNRVEYTLVDGSMDSLIWASPLQIKTIDIPHFPRRGKRVLVRLYQNDSPQPAAVFEMPNPTQQTYPEWKPEPLPAVHKESGMTVTLTKASLQSYIMEFDGSSSYWRTQKRFYHPQNSPPGAQARYEYQCPSFGLSRKQEGNSRAQWNFGNIALQDATGNEFPCFASYSMDENYATDLFTEYPAGEAVGKLRVELTRSGRFPLPAEEQQTLNTLNCPKKKQGVYLAKAFTLEGKPVDALLFGSGQATVKNGGNAYTVTCNKPTLGLLLPNEPKRMHPIIQVTDEAGHIVSNRSGGSLSGGGSTDMNISGKVFNLSASMTVKSMMAEPFIVRDYDWAKPDLTPGAAGTQYLLLYILPDAKPGSKLTVHFAPNPSRYVEFLTSLPKP